MTLLHPWADNTVIKTCPTLPTIKGPESGDTELPYSNIADLVWPFLLFAKQKTLVFTR